MLWVISHGIANVALLANVILFHEKNKKIAVLYLARGFILLSVGRYIPYLLCQLISYPTGKDDDSLAD